MVDDNLFLSLHSREDLQRLVDEGLEESLTLDYKASPALSRESTAINELCKDISALANSAGGQIVYGVEQDKGGKPSRVDDGVTDAKITREWIIQILSGRVQPRMDGITVERIALSAEGSGFVITVPPTRIGPHQAPDKKYYKRFELHSVPMEDYEVRDVMNRDVASNLRLDLSFGGSSSHQLVRPNPDRSGPVQITAQIVNVSREPAFYSVTNVFIPEYFDLQSAGTFHPQDRMASAEELGPCHRIMSVQTTPPQLPIFQERPLSIGGFTVSVPTVSLAEPLQIGWTIVAPGCANSGVTRIRFASGALIMQRPWAPKTGTLKLE